MGCNFSSEIADPATSRRKPRSKSTAPRQSGTGRRRKSRNKNQHAAAQQSDSLDDEAALDVATPEPNSLFALVSTPNSGDVAVPIVSTPPPLTQAETRRIQQQRVATPQSDRGEANLVRAQRHSRRETHAQPEPSVRRGSSRGSSDVSLFLAQRVANCEIRDVPAIGSTQSGSMRNDLASGSYASGRRAFSLPGGGLTSLWMPTSSKGLSSDAIAGRNHSGPGQATDGTESGAINPLAGPPATPTLTVGDRSRRGGAKSAPSRSGRVTNMSATSDLQSGGEDDAVQAVRSWIHHTRAAQSASQQAVTAAEDEADRRPVPIRDWIDEVHAERRESQLVQYPTTVAVAIHEESDEDEADDDAMSDSPASPVAPCQA